MSALYAAALRYAELGYRVFPCAPGRKTPLTARGFHEATTDPAQIEEWWTRYPQANIGIATEGLVVIDVDGPGNTWLTDEPERAAELGRGALAITPRDGKHFCFRQPDGFEVRCQVGLLAPRVDVRAAGGYILASPSVVGGKTYRWVEGSELDRPPAQLPLPPPWLIERLARLDNGGHPTPRVASSGTVANAIPSGQRNATLARLAGTMRRVGMTQDEISAALNRANADRCQPPLERFEVAAIAASVGRYAPDEIAVALTEDHFGQQFGTTSPAELNFAAITSRELDENAYELEYLINGILVRGQPGVIAGPKKTLKTNLSIDLALSLGSGGRFAGYFQAEREVRVGVMSGESGAATIQETARRIAAAKGARLADFEHVYWSFEVPQLGNVLHTDALKRFIEARQLEVLILDPTYLMMLGLGDNAGNLFIVGSFLKSLGEIAQETGSTPLLCHHLKKGIADPYEPAELENIAWAGFQEFVRQWILLNRRMRYDPERGGSHGLWMSVGGSAGHSGLWGLDIEEGTRQDLGGRRWQVEVLSSADAYAGRLAAASDAAEERKELQQQSKRQKQRNSVLNALRKLPEGGTARVLREMANVSGSVIADQLEQLEAEGLVAKYDTRKHNRRERGYRLVDGGTAGTSQLVPASGDGGGTGLYK